MNKERSLVISILIADILLLVLTVAVLFWIFENIDPNSITSVTSWPKTTGMLILCFLASYTIFPSVAQHHIVKTEDVVRRAFITGSLMLLMSSLLVFVVKIESEFPRKFLLTFYLAYTTLLIIERITIRKTIMRYRSAKNSKKNIVIIGKGTTVSDIFSVLSNKAYGYNIVATFYDGESTDKRLEEKKQGELHDIYSWLERTPDIQEIYGFLPQDMYCDLNAITKYCDNHLIRFYYIPPVDIFGGKISLTFVENMPVIARRNEPLAQPGNKFLKRSFDVICSGLFLVLVFPWIYLIVGIIIKFSSHGPIIFKQTRTGLDGKEFICYKFRTMKVNDAADKVQATKNDPRKYPFGNFLRKTNIDELPQFINVFKGDMSMVGPRPHMLKHTEEYSQLINRFMVRHLAKPGITGLAQVTGFRGETRHLSQMEGRVKKDIEYIENWTFLLDLKIMVKTITNMLGGEKMAY